MARAKVRLKAVVGGVLRRAYPEYGRTNASSRERWLEATLLRVPPGTRILDAGAGRQQYRRFCGHLDYVSQDFAGYEGHGDGVGLQKDSYDYGSLDIVSDITEIPEPDGSFGAIMCIEVFEHIPQPRLAIAEFARLLAPDGHLIVTAPFASLTHFAPYYYYGGFSPYFFNEALSAHGFRDIELERNGSYFAFLAQELARLPSVAGRYAGAGAISRATLALRSIGLARTLGRLQRADNGSAELLCFGTHVYARRV